MSDLLKQAIADAKAVRATALANAKAALEEAFAPKLQSMLATKLQQEVDAEEGDELPDENPVAPVDTGLDGAGATDEVPVPDAPAPDLGVGGAPVEAPVDDMAGLNASPDAALDAAPAPDAGLGLDAAPADAAPAPEGLEGDEELPMEEDTATSPGTAAGGNPTPGYNLAEEKASPDYKKTTKGAKTEDPQGAKKELSSGPGKADKKGTTGSLAGKGGTQKASPDYKKTTTGHKTPDPQGAKKELSSGPGKADKNVTGKVLEETDEVSDETLDEILKELESEVALENCGAETTGATAPEGEAPQMEEEIDLSALLESDDKDEDDKEEKEEDEDEDDKDEKKKNLPPWLQKENISLKKELQEYRSTVEYLRDRINEVNLLNAKLLYTNKLFKQAQLTNEQKLKVIEQFDLTKSVREAKLTYANLAESLSFGARKTVSAPAPVAKKSAIVKTITEGLASKAVASTKPTKAVITEGAEMANRFKKLAGIRSVVK
jgi:hypothetical protein